MVNCILVNTFSNNFRIQCFNLIRKVAEIHNGNKEHLLTCIGFLLNKAVCSFDLFNIHICKNPIHRIDPGIFK